MEYETISYELDGHVAVLTYDRPEQRNAVSRADERRAPRRLAALSRRRRRVRARDHRRAATPSAPAGTSQDAADWPTAGDWDEFRTHVYNSPGDCGYTRRVDVFKPVIAAVNGWAVAAGLENALLADIRIVAENAVFGALERRWNIVAGDGMTVRLPLVVGYAKAMEMIITGRPVDAEEALRIGLANEVVPEGKALERALELAHEIAALPQGAIRTDKETMVRNVGRTYEEQLRNEVEATLVDVHAPRLARDRRRRLQARRDARVAATTGSSAYRYGRAPQAGLQPPPLRPGDPLAGLAAEARSARRGRPHVV